jgi:sulfatase modifying factor 1
MDFTRLRLASIAAFFPSLLHISGCAVDALPDVPGARVEIAVAPLTLPGVSKVCYDLRVTNGPDGTGDTVWQKGSLGLSPGGDTDAVCSSSFGNGSGGDITFIGACDASGTAQSSVTLWIDGVYDGNLFISPTGSDGWQNPCEAGCTLNLTCKENEDVRVEFNLTILRQANQGFFDIGVNFEDIFCSAKVDCLDSADQPLKLLFNGGQRDTTIVSGLACTAGPGGTSTMLYRNPLVVTCDGGVSATLDPSVGKGNAWPTFGTPDDPVWQYAIYADAEELDCGGQNCQKRFWNIAFGLDETADNCRLTTTMTAAPSGRMANYITPARTKYPVINIDVTLTGTSGLSCTRHPINGSTPGVSTGYTGLGSRARFTSAFDGVAFSKGPSLNDYALIPAGSFVMGSPITEFGRPDATEIAAGRGPEDQVNVTLTRDFLMQTSEVTQGAYKKWSGGYNPSVYQTSDEHPVERVNWFNALAYANWLSISEGLPPCYDFSTITCVSGNQWLETWNCGNAGMPSIAGGGSVQDCLGYRLPTEAEWEYAARAGVTAATYNLSNNGGELTALINNDDTLNPIAWYQWNAGGERPVKGRLPNAFGLYDMLGNVAEWAWDRHFSQNSKTLGGTDPIQNVSGGGLRPNRGGGVSSYAKYTRLAARFLTTAGNRTAALGFRLVRTVK